MDAGTCTDAAILDAFLAPASLDRWIKDYALGGSLSPWIVAPDPAPDASVSNAVRWTAPSMPGADTWLWAVVRNEYGGLTWAEQRIVVE